jgi:hypothetical protein
MSLAYLCNTCWMAACYRESRAYARSSKNAQPTQAKLLQRFIDENRSTSFGRKHHFRLIESPRDFQQAVPLSTYDEYRESITQIGSGEQNVLTTDRVRLLEPTGGSSGSEKLIPYTATLQRSFQRAIRVWIWDLFSKRPAVRRGRSYWSISPLTSPNRRTPGGIPIGFDDDAAYLSMLERPLVQNTMAVPRELALCRSVLAAQYATLFFLLRAPDLSLISVWSPTFLTQLLNLLWERWADLCEDIAAGQIRCESPIDGGPAIQRRYPPQSARADGLRLIFGDTENISQCIQSIWPALSLVSCWADGPATIHANNLRQLLPDTELQSKGLLATESFVTVPLLDCEAPALAIRSHFFEFVPTNHTHSVGDVPPLLAHELTAGRRYSVVVTNGGGLYRYQLHDEVEVIGFMNDVPLLRFIGKTNDISDLVGEKLSAAHVDSVLRTAFRDLHLFPAFAQLRAFRATNSRYVLQVTCTRPEHDNVIQRKLCDAVEHGLCGNPGYRYARELGQLEPVTVEWLDRQQADAINAQRISERVASGQRLGDIKPTTIDHAQSAQE